MKRSLIKMAERIRFHTLSRFLFSLMICLFSYPVLFAQFAGGSGTEADPWQIETAEHLYNVRDYTGYNHPDKHFIQIADIDLGTAPWNEGEGWDPIGYGISSLSFRGKYDGNGHTIDNLYINRPDTEYIGLFGSIRASISNLNLTNVIVLGYRYVGSLAGFSGGSTITNCFSSGCVSGNDNVGGLLGYTGGSYSTGPDHIINCQVKTNVSGNQFVGGLVGYDFYSIMNDSYIIGSVSGKDYIGGLAGMTRFSEINNCYSETDVTGVYHIGGLVGLIRSNSNVNNSFSMGNVNGSVRVGGLAGSNSSSIISNSYSTGNVTGSWYLGGLIGYNEDESTVSDCYSRGRVTGTGDRIGGLVGYHADNSLITNCYSTGLVTGSGNGVGGLIGREYQSLITNSYWNVETSGQSASDGGEGRTGEEMTYPYDNSTFVGWDFEEIWAEDLAYEINNGYPYLRDVTVPVSVDEEFLIVPEAITLCNYPNPFNPDTTIEFYLPDRSIVKIHIYNMRGQKIITLINQQLSPGQHTVSWNGCDDRGKEMPSGVYFYRLTTGQQTFTRKMMLLK